MKMQPTQLDQADGALSPEKVTLAAGEWLVSVCDQRDSVKAAPPPLSPLEQLKFDEFFTLYKSSPFFKTYHIEAVRICLSKRVNPDYRLARELMGKDLAGDLFANENNVLQVAIKAARIQPGLLGKSPEESCPELLQICRELIFHGAPVDCIDSDGNSPVFYACVLGYEELFRFLVDSGASISTTHRRFPPSQLKEEEDSASEMSASEEEEYGKGSLGDLLQITLDAMLSPQRVADMTWVGWPPGLMLDIPMWELDLRKTWGAIALFLLRKGLKYEKDVPGLVMILHIACYQGAMEIINELLDFKVAMDVATPRLKDMGTGLSRSFGTAFHAAAAQSQLSVAKLLMEKGASPCACCPCIFRGRSDFEDMTPARIAISLGDDETDKLLVFLEALIDSPEGLEESDLATIVIFGAKWNHIDFVKRLLNRGIVIPEIKNVGSLEMAKLLLSHDAHLDAATIQKTALNRKQLDLLRWSVDEHGPLLLSDVESWGSMAFRCTNSGTGYFEAIKYLVLEYPGPHIDTVITATLRLPGQKQSHPTPTSWLHLAALHDNIQVLHFLLDEGDADPECPGLPHDAATAIRTCPHNLMRRIPERLEIIHMLEGYNVENGLEHIPPYTKLMSYNAPRIAVQKPAWKKRVSQLVANRQDIPFTANTIANLNTSPPKIPTKNPSLSFSLLSNSKSAIRLLELFPAASKSDCLSGHLISTDLTFQPVYEAVSYVWGESSHNEFIAIHDRLIPITPNLHSALIHLRQKTKSRTLWIDAVCIQQSVHSERNQQVTIMGDIYRAAKQVVVWLGEAADNSHLVFAHLNDETRVRSFINQKEPTPDERQAWNALVTRPWFFRTWVIQEVALSRNATIMCGDDFAPWKDLGRGRDISGGGDGLSTVRSSPGSNPDHPLSGFNADRHAWRLRLLSPGSDPVDLLRYSRNCQTTEPRDRIYGILGLFIPGFMRVDYNMPLGQIFRDFTEAVIRSTGDLRILTCLDASRLHLDEYIPSWVPNLAAATTTVGGVLPFHRWWPPYRSGGRSESYNCRMADGNELIIDTDTFPRKILPGLAFKDDGAIVIKGKLVDTILALGPELPAREDCVPGSPEFMNIMRSWESLAARLIQTRNTSLGPSITLEFGTTIVAEYDSYLYSVEAGFTEWYRYCGTGILQDADPSIFLRKLEYYIWWVNVGKEINAETEAEDALGYDLKTYASKVDLACYGRRFFITEAGSMGLAGPDACVGDRIAFIPGGDRPFVLRKREDAVGWTMANNCYLHGLDPYELFEDEEVLVDEFLIY